MIAVPACGRPTSSAPPRRPPSSPPASTPAPSSIDRRLRETDVGPWEGLTAVEIEAGWPGFLATGARPPGFEPEAELIARTVAGTRGRGGRRRRAPADRRVPRRRPAGPAPPLRGARRPPSEPRRHVVLTWPPARSSSAACSRPATAPGQPTPSRSDLPRRSLGRPIAFRPRGYGQARAPAGQPAAEVRAAGQGGLAASGSPSGCSSAAAPPSPCWSSSSCSPGSSTATAMTTTRAPRRRVAAAATSAPATTTGASTDSPSSHGFDDRPGAVRLRHRRVPAGGGRDGAGQDVHGRTEAVHRPDQDVHGDDRHRPRRHRDRRSTRPRRRARSTTS